MRFFNVFSTAVLTLFLTSACTSNMVCSIQSKQKVKVESIPVGADIYMDGELIGTTPIVLSLQSDMTHEIHFQKKGYKPTKRYLDPIYKHEKQPYVQIGLAKDLGYYYELSSDHLVAELEWESLPDTAGIQPFETMSGLIAKADNALSSGDLTVDEHDVIIHQIVELFNSN